MNAKFLITATTLVIGATAATLPASAYDKFDRTDVRQANQAKRIQQGIRSGELTRQEAAKLQNQQEYIRSLERSAERDGKVTRHERARIEAAQNAASRSIYAEKHDAQDRDRLGNRRWFGKSSHNDHGKRPWFRRWW